jgi:eukaryotic-like serine/threonine-protein kinase
MRPGPGDLISGKYRLVRLIGDGGMGSVFEARHEYLGTAVALKFLHPELARRPGLVARFLQEARLAASIKSPHIARVTDVDQTADGAAYLVMELLEGESLQAVLDRQRRLPRDVALDYTLQILSALEAAHAIGAVHRDLKPDNVFVVTTQRGPFVKLLDFGIAKLRNTREFQVGLTRPGVVMGTPEYMAPEQAFSADVVDARADVYSVGTMLYEMLAGERPAQGDNAQEIAGMILAHRVRDLRTLDGTIPEGLARAVHRAMAPTPPERFTSAAELRDAITPFCGTLSAAGKLAATPGPPEAGTPFPPIPSSGPPTPAVAPTLPPAPIEPRGGTQAAPVPVLAQAAGALSGGTSPMPPLRTQVPAQAYAAGNAFTPAPSPTRAGSPRRLSWLLLSVVALAAGGIVVFAVVQMNSDAPRPRRRAVQEVPTVVASAVPSGPATPAALAPPAISIAPPIQPPAPALPAAHASTKSHPAASADAGEPSAKPVPTFPQLPFPIPSQIPSQFPVPLPSTFPPFPIPGFPGAASSAAPATSK